MPPAWATPEREETTATAESIENADGFAQVFPEHKFHIVDVLQKRGHIVGMTGDGVNDAPALKKADCGIAVSAATDAARAAASIVLMKPGLSVIIDAVKESRRIVQRMNSYAIYRIAETLRVLLFVTLAILIFNFFPVTAVMIVVLALLNDGSILSIAYDNVHYKNQPEAWNMRLVIGIATVLGVVGPIAAFGLFYLGDRVYHLNHAHLQTLMYLMLSVAGSMTIYLTRTRGPFWSIRPARILVLAVTGAEVIATLLAVYGIFMTPIGWRWALVVWGYAIIWFLITDRVKLAAYRILDPVNTNGAARPGAPRRNPLRPLTCRGWPLPRPRRPRSIPIPIPGTGCSTTAAIVPTGRKSGAAATTGQAPAGAAGVTGAPGMRSGPEGEEEDGHGRNGTVHDRGRGQLQRRGLRRGAPRGRRPRR